MAIPSELYLIITTYAFGPIKPAVNASRHFTTNQKTANSESTIRFNAIVRARHLGNHDPSVHSDTRRKFLRMHKLDGKDDVDMVEVRAFKIDTETLLPETAFVVLQITAPQDGVMREVIVQDKAYVRFGDAFMRAAEMADNCSETEYKCLLGKDIEVQHHSNGESSLRAAWYDSIPGADPWMPVRVYAWFDVVKVVTKPQRG